MNRAEKFKKVHFFIHKVVNFVNEKNLVTLFTALFL